MAFSRVAITYLAPSANSPSFLPCTWKVSWLPSFQANPPARLNQVRLFIYRYQASQRTLPAPAAPHDPEQGFSSVPPSLPLPPVDASIQDNKDYFVTEVYFTWAEPNAEGINWIALVEVVTGSVLYLRPLVGCLATALVFQVDPVTQSGDPADNPGAGGPRLDTLFWNPYVRTP